jgi:hypothetical protein
MQNMQNMQKYRISVECCSNVMVETPSATEDEVYEEIPVVVDMAIEATDSVPSLC